MGVVPGIEYEVQRRTHEDGLGQDEFYIKYFLEENRNPRTFSLGLNADTQGFKAGDKVVFRAEIKPLKLSDQKLSELGVKRGDKFTVKKDEYNYRDSDSDSSSYIEVNGQKMHLWKLKSIFNAYIDQTPAGEILIIAGEQDK